MVLRRSLWMSLVLTLIGGVALAFGDPAVEKKPAADTPTVKAPPAEATPAATKAEDSASDGKQKRPAPDSASDKEPKKSAPAKPKSSAPTHTVKKEVLKIQVEIQGVFEAREMAELALRPEQWKALCVLEAAEHGTKVKKGEVVLRLDPEKLDHVLADGRTKQKLAEIALQRAREQLAALEKTTPLDLESGERAQRIAQENQEYYFDIDRPFALKAAEMYLKFARKRLEYERQELEQLEKMYQEDDLVEETEEIVLQRQRDTVEYEEFKLQIVEIYHDEMLKFTIPRRDERMKETTQRQSIRWRKDKIDLPLALKKQGLEVKKLQVQLSRARDELKKLQADRALMTVKAPIDGYVYYGQCVQGKFKDATALAATLRRGGTIAPHQVFMTIVAPRPVYLHASIAEKQRHYFRPGSEGTVVPTAFPELKFPAVIDEIGAVPIKPGQFDAKLDVHLDAQARRIVPGMSCKIKFTPYLKTEALTVPPKAVFAEPEDDQQRYVYVLDAEGKPEKRSVTVGKETGKQAEILKGLRAGDKILLEKPKDEK